MGDIRLFGPRPTSGKPVTRTLPKPLPEPALREPLRRSRTDAELPAVPEHKLYFKIGEVAALVGVEPHVLRYWEAEFRSLKPTKSKSGQRVYSRDDLKQLKRIRELVHERKFTIAGARRELRSKGFEPRDPADPTIVENHRVRETLIKIREDLVGLLAEFGE